MKICQKAETVAKVIAKFCQILNKQMPKNFNMLPKWRNFAKSGHTEFVNSCEKYEKMPFFGLHPVSFGVDSASCTTTNAHLQIQESLIESSCPIFILIQTARGHNKI